MNWKDENLVNILREGGVTVIPTDTIYGIVGRAESEATVNRIYEIRKRREDKPSIILIGNMAELKKFSINLSPVQKNSLEKYWPGPVSIVLEAEEASISYLHRGTKTLAFRVPAEENFREFLLKVGPIIAPSANPEGGTPAKTTEEAKKYFGDNVDYYLDGGEINGKPSQVIKLASNGEVTVLRN
jgi:L-threonylcarbamoyladenylate synthase